MAGGDSLRLAISSTMSKRRKRMYVETPREVFTRVLAVLLERGC